MPRQLDKAAVKKLLHNPETKVIRNQLMEIGGLVLLFIPILAWEMFVLIDVFSFSAPGKIADMVESILLILVLPAAFVIAYIIASRRIKMALTHEGMFFSHVDTEDYRGPLSRRNLFVRWDEFTQLKLTNGPIMTFRVKGERYNYTVGAFLISSRVRAKKHLPFVEAICSYSGYVYHFQKGEGLTWQYLFASANHTFDVEAEVADWETLEPVRQ